jgi:ribosomal protein S18 acetylase RimI-like enzyme
MRDLTPHGINFRPIEVADLSLLSAIYASTRADEMALVPGWTDEQKTAFLAQQFQAQHTYYQANFQQAAFQIILFENQSAGRLYLNQTEKAFHIIDISLLPEYRRRGIGELILRSIFDDATAVNKVVSIHVERNNPALRLYQRLGFTMLDDSHPIYLLMEWRAA